MEEKEELEAEKQWVELIKGKLRDAGTREQAPCPSIFMASSPLRGLKLEAFIPQVVAIGPLHSDLGPYHSSFPENEETQRYKMIAAADMEKHKIMASHRLSKSLCGRDFGKLVDAFLRDICRVRAQYDTILACKTDKKLAYMLALDAAFVVEVLRCSDGSSSRRFPPPLRKSILQDFVLLENQIPLFLLLKVIQMDEKHSAARGGNKEEEEAAALKELQKLVRNFAMEVLPFSIISEESFSAVLESKLGEKKHLLDCLFGIMTHADIRKQDHGSSAPGSSSSSSCCKLDVQVNGVVEKPTHFPAAVDLQSCGIRLRPVAPGNMSSVRFESKRATLFVPKIRVGDDTERLMRNLIAYESHLVDNVQVLSYLRFMNSLVDTPEDVALLVEKGIIAQDIGSNEQVAKMWNNLCVNTMRVCTKEYEEVAVQLVHHCQFRMNAWKAEFKRTYLSPPWLFTSLLSGAALLIMTFLINYYTIKLYLKPGG